jgi:hypothetical protein
VRTLLQYMMDTHEVLQCTFRSSVNCNSAILSPISFPYQENADKYRGVKALLSRETFRRVDFLGAGLLLLATTFLVAPLLEAGQFFAWKSAFTISLLTISGIGWILHFMGENYYSQSQCYRAGVSLETDD